MLTLLRIYVIIGVAGGENMEFMPIEKNYVIEKRNIVNEMKANGWKLQELRFFNLYLAKINARDESTRVVRFSLERFGEIMELKRAQPKDFEPTLEKLLSKVIIIREERGGFTGFQLFKECKVTCDDFGNWYVEINAHDKSLPLLFDFKEHYFNYPLWVILRLSGTKQFRMYEILKQYENIGARSLSLEDLRNMLGIEQHEYNGRTSWSDFKRWVLDSCQAALLEKTDIKYTYEPIRKGRGGKVAGIKFVIEKNDNYVDQLCFDEYLDPRDVYPESTMIAPMSASLPETPQKKSAADKKKALDEAKKSDFWYYAFEKAKKATHIKVTPEQYARGIVENWNSAGYETVTDLVESGEISKQDVDKKPSFNLDEFDRQIMEKYKQ
jgi:plasmid replication initiation protein